jgi:predicted 3-demethylubiquinone-9 3-methyltransferase (glyoxalase superfamily)
MSKITPCLWFPDKARRVAEAMLKMVKLDIAGLRKAYEGAR